MEHEEIIQRKIREAELQPIHWGREVVWTRLQNGGNAARKTRVYYYAAGFIFIALCVTAYLTWPRKNESLELQTKRVAITIDTLAKSDQKEDVLVKTEIPIINVPKKPVRRVLEITRPESTLLISDTTRDENVTVIQPEEIQETQVAATEEKIISRNLITVQAIVGVIPPQKQRFTAVKTRRQLRLFRDRDKAFEPLSTENGHSLTARIN